MELLGSFSFRSLVIALLVLKSIMIAGKEKHQKHVSFRNGTKVTVVNAPPTFDRPKLWFQESEAVVTKPLVFEIPAGGKISINIGLSVKLTSIASAEQTNKRTELRVCSNDEQEFDDSLDERLKSLMKGKLSREPRWCVCGSTQGGVISKINVMLPAGEYLLQCAGESSLTVFGQAADVERRLE